MTSPVGPHFCLECGAQMAFEELEGIMREVCGRCGWVYYRQLKVGASAFVVSDNRLLLAKRGADPWKGYWNLPAGYVEVFETPAQAVVREVKEETGLEVLPVVQLRTDFFDDDPRGNGIMVSFGCQVIGGSLKTSQESVELRYFAPKEIPGNIAGGAHDVQVADWAAGVFPFGG